ncbi:protein containing DUF296 [Candidatus Omnitrophus magneticus]|uniref:Protein containing DUF296 n=1 Tax=Candidatus Omnitrophus magneticus TaxID=1609969 RepID=A0A0F0CN31_9BACT|nr:protein containing DUF296 [Candidatus Omnitrophus magneticus]
MEYSTGIMGRVFIVKFEHEEDVLLKIEELAKKEHIKFATIVLLGALQSADIVSGPIAPVIPPEPHWKTITGVSETVGFGNIILRTDGSIKSHIHVNFGNKNEVLTGCLRKNGKVFITIEAVITEIITKVNRRIDPVTGIETLKF